ncbi:hypothetical protein [Pontibacter mangrovi]|uniref:Uncharacterized protein n=1 Tax=Pontibacter mangrovi TaxID=2589816 RepID=A0A501W792_9BACT|nr:hypothetical protein [Pontibacter mangrovi]TPE45803.1 hypothetical protein FJM65_00190 [Pontibacter mangrovi]
MIYMQQFIPRNAGQKLERLQQWARLRQEQMSDAIYLTKNTVLDYLLHQLERGNWRGVQDVLHGKPMTRAGKFMYSELRDRVVGRLIMRLGLRKAIAVVLALVLLPVILAQASGGLFRKLRS